MPAESCQNDKSEALDTEESSESKENQPEVVPLDDQRWLMSYSNFSFLLNWVFQTAIYHISSFTNKLYLSNLRVTVTVFGFTNF